MNIDPERLAVAERFLQEAVYRSRAQQAAVNAPGPGADSRAGCGLGARAEVVLELDERGRELFSALWPGETSEAELARIQAALREWVRAQDAHDRRRNHFMKEFRQRHGFDRHAYAPALLAEYDQGLEAINAEVAGERRAAAERMLGAG